MEQASISKSTLLEVDEYLNTDHITSVYESLVKGENILKGDPSPAIGERVTFYTRSGIFVIRGDDVAKIDYKRNTLQVRDLGVFTPYPVYPLVACYTDKEDQSVVMVCRYSDITICFSKSDKDHMLFKIYKWQKIESK